MLQTESDLGPDQGQAAAQEVAGLTTVHPVEGRALADSRPLTAEEASGVAAALATALAGLHELGMVHGKVDATMVSLDDEGRPALCGPGPGGSEPGEDVAALGRLMTQMLARRLPERAAPRGWLERRRRLGPMLAPPAAPALAALAAEACAPDPARRPTARALAAAISQHIPTARLPKLGPAPHAGPRTSAGTSALRRLKPPSFALPAAAAAVVVVVVGAILALLEGSGPAGPPAVESAPAAGGAPPTVEATGGADHAGRVDYAGGVLTVDGIRYGVGRAGDAVAIGDWSCSGRPTPVILRPSSGELFAFDSWAEPGRDVSARPLERVERATGVRATPVAGTTCHELEVLRSQGPPERLDVTP